MTRPNPRVGRPAEQRRQEVRRQLVDAARELFSQRGFEAVSLREVAQAAGVTPAMVHYYFGGRHGLWKAVLEDTLEGVLEAMRGAREDIEAPGGLAVYLRRHAATLGANPWLAPLLYREVVLAGPSADFVDRFPARLRALLGGAIEQARARGEIDPALDPRLVLLSLIAAAVFPFVFRPLVEKVLDMPIDAGFAARWADHAQRLFYAGVRP
jgi:AcrR family transcriptional regulator